MDVGYYYVFKTPGESQTCCQTFHPLIQALNFRETGHKLRSWEDGFTWCLSCIPVLVAKGRNSLLSTHTRQVFLVVVVMFSFVHCGSLLPLLRCFWVQISHWHRWGCCSWKELGTHNWELLGAVGERILPWAFYKHQGLGFFPSFLLLLF